MEIKVNEKEKIYPSLIKYKEELILIDAGYKNTLTLFEESLNSKNFSFSDITKIIITHHDHDHIGNLYEIKNKFPHIKIGSTENEAKYISGKEKFLRLKKAEELQENLDESEKQFGLDFQSYLNSIENIEVDFFLKEKDVLLENNIEIIETPGHSKGDLCIYLKKENILITGDYFAIENNKIETFIPDYAYDLKNIKKSLLKLNLFDIKEIISYHSGIYKNSIENIKKMIKETE